MLITIRLPREAVEFLSLDLQKLTAHSPNSPLWVILPELDQMVSEVHSHLCYSGILYLWTGSSLPRENNEYIPCYAGMWLEDTSENKSR